MLANKHTEGSLLFVGLKNFMTFRDSAFQPKPGFNVIVGPNGAGKSSIICAIHLGLGGDIGQLNRQTSLDDFINNETRAKEAVVTLRLTNDESDEKTFHEIVVQIKKGSKECVFKLNGTLCPKSEVVEFVRGLQIQTDNMCQFLPQDVVSQFPKMSPKKILQNTVRAVGDQETLKLYGEIEKVRKSLEMSKKNLEHKSNIFNEVSNKRKNKKDILKSVEEKKKVGELISLNEIQGNFIQLKELKNELYKMGNYNAKLKEKVEKEKKIFEELKSKLKKYDEAKKANEKAMLEQKKICDRVAKNLDSLEIERKTRQVESLEKQIKDCMSRIGDHQKRIGDEKGKLQNLQEEKLSTNFGELEEKVETLRKRSDEAWVRKDRRQYDLGFVEGEKRTILETLREIRNKRSHIQTDHMVKMRILLHRNKDAYQAVELLEQNAENLQLEKTVHGPIMKTIKLMDPSYATFIQKLVGRNDLEAFVCETSSDMNKIMTFLRVESGLKKINVVHSASKNVPVRKGNLPKTLSDSLCDYVSGMFDCPDVVKSFLCLKYKLHEIPVFSEDVNTSMAERHFNKFFVEKKFYSSRIGRYSQKRSTNIDDCSHDQIFHFPVDSDGFDDDGEIRRLDEQILTLEERARNTEERIRAEKSEIDRLSREVAESKKELKEKETALTKAGNLENQIQLTRKRIEELEQSDGKNMALMKKKKEMECQQLLKNLVDDVKRFDALREEGEQACVVRALHRVKGVQLDRTNIKDETKRTNQQRILAKQQKELEEANQNRNSKIQAFKKLAERMRSNLVNPTTLQLKPEIAKKVNQECPPDLEQVKAKLVTLNDQLKLLPKFSQQQIDSAQEIEAKYFQVRKEEKTLSADVNASEKSLENLESALTKRIGTIVKSVDDRFSRLMSQMGNAGTVSLEQDSSSGEYGLCLKVQFSSKSSMQTLSASVQSGGEKSVTAALYMLALQEMTHVPFRCVDEINQGMDTKNEETIWKMILDTAAQYSAQYLYLAPKFPRNLDFSESVTVSIVMNGNIQKNV